MAAVRFGGALRGALLRAVVLVLGKGLVLEGVGASLPAFAGARGADAADAVHELEGGLGVVRARRGGHRPRAADASGVFRIVRCSSILGLDLHLADGLAHGDGLALFGERANEDAGVRRRRFHAHLVGDDLDEGVVLLDALAGLDEPLADDALRDRLAYLG